MPRTKKQRRQSTGAVIYVLVCVIVIIFLTIIGISTFMKITDIVVEGASRYSKDEIISASGFTRGDSLLFINTAAIERKIQAELPYISAAKIEVKLPDNLYIAVVESEAIATVRFRNNLMIVDSATRVVETMDPGEDIPAGLIEIRGFTPESAELGARLRADVTSSAQLQALRDMLEAVERENFEEYVTYIDVSNITNVTFDYTETFKIVLDSPNTIRQNMAMLPQAVAEHEVRLAPGARGTIIRDDATGSWRMTPER